MAETTEFNHDQLGRVLTEHLVAVPRFQRSYAWDRTNVEEYISDLDAARKKKVSYFMGTLVFAQPSDGSDRRQIVDGQQRLATTAVMFIAIRDMLAQYGKRETSDQTEQRYLRRYVLSEESEVVTLTLSPKDQDSYDALLEERHEDLDEKDRLRICYEVCRDYLRETAPTGKQYRRLIEVADHLEKSVQVLVAVATDLPEAYVIFETLNDRGADLTTADLLKNYLFSQARGTEFAYVENAWTVLEERLGKPEDLVKFVRYDYVSRNGPVTTRKLYRAIQQWLADSKIGVKKYLQELKESSSVYQALRDTDDAFWNTVNVDVKDAILAYRRFGFESSMPVLLAAFRTWGKPKGARLFVKLARWSVRAQFVGRIGASLSEDAFGAASAAISNGSAVNQPDVRRLIKKLIPTDGEFKAAFAATTDPPTARAKYLLAMLERAQDDADGLPSRALEWSSVGVTIEHVMPKSAHGNDDEKRALIGQLGNLALLEKRINKDMGSKSFATKSHLYSGSDFHLTQALANESEWTAKQIQARTARFAELACIAWPAT
ncbi:DUF262 domain-containing protein [Pimelobacter simplex]|uniref:Uncharacterized protein n=1 Tax=Nocardioides simplex TaxID=2045 RepID=A0A0J9YH48_NOCSI|nr:DUF262 domain-containing protein [Pimelobacter simplex]AIY16702.1 hypothetical protein KR76_07845 [Pimelobacter simplex]MCG8154143.1 DUF262 domain-containing protein [Pimelobacter simplex]GEB15550.1 hypothetical protein NSI01_38650 [Pimelobacter simplex]SFM58364.1 Uncharacterized conserved protein, contains ParB-like and HNH nuclease domains [Pimelobacter simplex]